MRSKQEVLQDLMHHAQQLDPQHYELAAVAMIETEIQLDIRDCLDKFFTATNTLMQDYLHTD